MARQMISGTTLRNAVETGRAAPAVPALLLAMTIWAATYVVTKAALPSVGPFTILLARLVLGTLALLPFAWARGYRPRLSLRKEFVAFGLVGMVLHLGFEIVGLEFTSASSAVLVIASAPAVTAAFAIVFLKEKVSRLQALGIALSIAGVIVITGAATTAGAPLAWLGNLLVFAGVVSWGAFTVQGKRMAHDYPWLVSTTAATAIASVMTIPLAAGEIALQGPPEFTTAGIASLIYLGVGAQAAAYGLWNLALEHVDGSVAGAYINLVPVLGVLLAVTVGESLSIAEWAGGAIVALGVWLAHRGSPKQLTMAARDERLALAAE